MNKITVDKVGILILLIGISIYFTFDHWPIHYLKVTTTPLLAQDGYLEIENFCGYLKIRDNGSGVSVTLYENGRLEFVHNDNLSGISKIEKVYYQHFIALKNPSTINLRKVWIKKAVVYCDTFKVRFINKD